METYADCVRFLARTEGTLSFRRSDHLTAATLLRVEVRSKSIEIAIGDELANASIVDQTEARLCDACRALDQEIGG